MRKSITGAIAANILSICVAAALAQTAPAKSADTSKGKALVDAKGMTLYIFDRDASGKSNCNGACATNWPPLMAPSLTRPSTRTERCPSDQGRFLRAPYYLQAVIADNKAQDGTFRS